MKHSDTGNAPGSGRRAFKLTPKPTADQGAAAPEPRRFGGKSRRTLLIGGSVAMPLIITVASQPAFAKTSGGGTSLAMSGGGTKKTGSVMPGGDTVAMWQQNYPRLRQIHTVEASAFPAAVTGKRYLANPRLGAVFSLPTDAVNGVTFTAPDADLHDALHGRGTWEIFVTHKGETARRAIGGAFFAEATAAALNAAVYGEKAFGMTDAMVVDQVSQSLRNLQSKARVLAELNANITAAEIAGQLARHIEGGGENRGEIYYFAQMNSRGTA